jgi:hypothetical protein
VSRLFLAYLALQVLSGWLILFAIGWCLLEIYRGPPRVRDRDVEFWLSVTQPVGGVVARP